MRLIDLDQTIFVPIVDESKGGVEYEMEMSIGEMFDKFLDGFKPEIVDAVPVEWLRNIKDHIPGSIEQMGIDAVLMLWNNEQEGRT